jgi:beta-mannosidase
MLTPSLLQLLLMLLLARSAEPAVLQLPLDSQHVSWSLAPANRSYSIPARVPGCAHLDLLAAGLIGEPNDGYNSALQRWIASENFTFTATFVPPVELLASSSLVLLLEGVDTAASASLNGLALPLALSNMHRTYAVALPPGSLRAGENNTLAVAFTGPVPASLAAQRACESAHGPPCGFANCTCPAPWPGPAPNPLLINAYLRKEQQSFSWDFAPATGTQGLRAAPLLLGFGCAALREGAVVSMDLEPGDWVVNVTARLEGGGSACNGTLTAAIEGLPGASAAAAVAVPAGARGLHASVQLRLPSTGASAPRLWWPRGYGEPALYTLSLAFTASASGEVSAAAPLRVGFRTIALDQAPAPNAGNHFRLVVNGLLIHARGSNWVPHNSLPGRPAAAAQLAAHFAAAAFAHMNILRVWGGGVYASAAFMDAADAAGVIVFHDAMLGDQFYNTQQSFLASVGAEVEDSLFRLGSHASLGVLCGSNEMASGYSDAHHEPASAIPFYSALYFATVLANFSALLPFTPRVSSTPSNGNETAEAPWSASAEIVTRGDVHYYNLDGDCLNVSAYPRARWVTEHGWESFPSFFTLAPTLGGPEDYGFNSSMVASRQQHPPGQAQITAQVERNWGWPARAAGAQALQQRTARYRRLAGQAAGAGAAPRPRPAAAAPLLRLLTGAAPAPAVANATAFRDELHMTQVAAGVCLRTALERWRSFADDYSAEGGGTAGILYWQMAEPWAGPSWSTLELGGRYKVGHYLAARAFAPVLVAGALLGPEPGGGGGGAQLAIDLSLTTYDPALLPAAGSAGALTLTALAWAGGELGSMRLPGLALPPPHSTRRLATLPLAAVLQATGCPAPAACVLLLSVAEEPGGRALADNHVLLTPPRAFAAGLPDPGLRVTGIVPTARSGSSGSSFNVTVEASTVPVPLVWLETPLAGAWEDNAFLLTAGARVLRFDAEGGGVTPSELAATLAISSLWDIYGKL